MRTYYAPVTASNPRTSYCKCVPSAVTNWCFPRVIQISPVCKFKLMAHQTYVVLNTWYQKCQGLCWEHHLNMYCICAWPGGQYSNWIALRLILPSYHPTSRFHHHTSLHFLSICYPPNARLPFLYCSKQNVSSFLWAKCRASLGSWSIGPPNIEMDCKPQGIFTLMCFSTLSFSSLMNVGLATYT